MTNKSFTNLNSLRPDATEEEKAQGPSGVRSANAALLAYHKADGIDYSPEGIEALRAEVIQMRNAVMGEGIPEAVILLTHVTAILHYAIHLARGGRP